jgi:AcrR family transcriptional regulator
MARIAKDPEIRRQEILEAALDLFLDKGVDRTAVSHIVHEVGVAQGTFYYHFDSKDAVVDALAERISAPLGTVVEAIAADVSAPGAERFQRAVAAVLDAIELSRPHLEGLVRPGNEVLHDRVGDALRARLHTGLLAIVEAGNADGSLDATPPAETVELVLAAIIHFTRTQAHGGDADRMSRLRAALTRLVQRGLGMHTET